MKTPISYYGGKQTIVNRLVPLIPEHESYTETFFGGGTMFFKKEPVKNEVINDISDIVINFYKVLTLNYGSLKKLIDSCLVSKTTHRICTGILKRPKKHSPVKLAFAFWYCTNFSYMNKIGGGLNYCKDGSKSFAGVLENKKREFTELLVYRLKNAVIECDNAVKILKHRDTKKGFHFIDTPYVGTDQGHYKGFSENDLIDVLDVCGSMKGKFMLTHYKHPLLSEAIKKNGWNLKTVTYGLQIDRKGKSTKTECIIMNYDPFDGMQLNLFK